MEIVVEEQQQHDSSFFMLMFLNVLYMTHQPRCTYFLSLVYNRNVIKQRQMRRNYTHILYHELFDSFLSHSFTSFGIRTLHRSTNLYLQGTRKHLISLPLLILSAALYCRPTYRKFLSLPYLVSKYLQCITQRGIDED